MKLCKDCKWMTAQFGVPTVKCAKFPKIDPVWGDAYYGSCEVSRAPFKHCENHCGPEAKFFEPKEKE